MEGDLKLIEWDLLNKYVIQFDENIYMKLMISVYLLISLL